LTPARRAPTPIWISSGIGVRNQGIAAVRHLLSARNNTATDSTCRPVQNRGLFIANTVDDQPASMPVDVPTSSSGPPAPAHNGPAFWIAVSAREDGTFRVTNARNGFSKTYAK
jgi:hypothetical protein